MKDFKIYLQYFGACLADNKAWFINMGFNGLFSIDLDDFSLKFIHSIPFLDKYVIAPYIQCLCNSNKLFFLPNNCDRILVYDMEKDILQGISITEETEIYTTINIFQIDGEIWIFPQKMELGIFILDMDTLQIRENSELNDLLKSVVTIQSVVQLSDFQIAILENNRIVEINLMNSAITYIESLNKDLKVYSMKYDGTSYWILYRDSTDVYEWNRKKAVLTKYQLAETVWITNVGEPYSNIIFFENQIFLLGCRLKYIMKVDRKNHTINKAFDYPQGFRFVHNIFFMHAWPAFSAFNVIGSKILIHPGIGNMLLIYEPETNSIEGKELFVTSEELPFLQDYMKHYIENIGGLLNECEMDEMLEGFMSDVVLCWEDSNICNTNIIGEKIYNKMIQIKK